MAEWSDDFSYDYFETILQTVLSNFELCLFQQFPKIKNRYTGKPKILKKVDIRIIY